MKKGQERLEHVSTMVSYHNLLAKGFVPMPCVLQGIKRVCPHPECDGYNRMCTDWVNHSGK